MVVVPARRGEGVRQAGGRLLRAPSAKQTAGLAAQAGRQARPGTTRAPTRERLPCDDDVVAAAAAAATLLLLLPPAAGAAAAPCAVSAWLLRLRPATVGRPGGSCQSSQAHGQAERRGRAEASGSGDGIKGAVLHQLGIEAALPRMPNLRRWQRSGGGGDGWCSQGRIELDGLCMHVDSHQWCLLPRAACLLEEDAVQQLADGLAAAEVQRHAGVAAGRGGGWSGGLRQAASWTGGASSRLPGPCCSCWVRQVARQGAYKEESKD